MTTVAKKSLNPVPIKERMKIPRQAMLEGGQSARALPHAPVPPAPQARRHLPEQPMTGQAPSRHRRPSIP